MKIARGTLVMAMDGSKMLLLRNVGDTQRPILQTILEEKADNPPTSAQGSDRPGRSFSSTSPRRISVNDTDWHDEAKRQFTRQAIDALEQHCEGEAKDVILLAAPSVLGDFRKHASGKVKATVKAEIDKDVVNHSPEDIVAIIDKIDA